MAEYFMEQGRDVIGAPWPTYSVPTYRIAAMRVAGDNIEKRLQALNMQFHRGQQTITEELLEITAGFEALRSDAESSAASEEVYRRTFASVGLLVIFWR